MPAAELIDVASFAPAAALAAVGVVVFAQIAVLFVDNPPVAAKVALTAAGEVSWPDIAPHLFVLAATAVGPPAAVEIVTAAAVCGPSVAATLLSTDLVASVAAASIA